MEIREADSGFSIIQNGTTLVVHKKESPCLYLGKGTPSYTMYRGNFNVSDYLVERIGLPNYEYEKTDTGYRFQMHKSGIYRITMVVEEKDGRIIFHFRDNNEQVNRFFFRLYAHKDEHIYGCGEQFTYFDLKGNHFPLWTSEQGVGRNKGSYITYLADLEDSAGGDYYSTFFPQPTFVSSRKYYCHVETGAYSDFDFRHPEFHELQMWEIPEAIVLQTANSMKETVHKLTGFLGRQPELPDWIYDGIILGIQNGTQTCLDKLQKALDNGIKVCGIWAQDWEGQLITSFGKRLLWDWEWNTDLYPGLDQEIPKLKERGVRFLGYINPYLVNTGKLYKEAKKHGYLVKNDEEDVYIVDFGEFWCGIVDLTNRDAFNWFKDVIKRNMIDFGLSGWMADFGEYLPVDVKLHDGSSPEIMHNKWPYLWAQVNRKAIEESGKLGEVVFFMRAGFTGSQKYTTLIWAGDQNVDWSLDDGIGSVIPAALSLGMTGVGLHHSDIGGYTTLYGMKRTKELLIRWTEFAAFTPVMRTHEGNRPETNWQFDSDDETMEFFAYLVKIYTMLSPYTKALVKENAKIGLPAMRPMFLHYEEDPRCYSLKYQYLYGQDMLVAPIIDEGVSRRSVYLPDDQWVHLWSGTEYGNGDQIVKAPLGMIPVFYRKDSEYSELFQEIGAMCSNVPGREPKEIT
ncbi:MAG: alpha-glucosidase [Spirochaetia bacterium]